VKIFEIQLKDTEGSVLYKSLVPEVHIREKVDTLIAMNDAHLIGAILIKEIGDISERYIRKYLSGKTPPE